MLSIKAVTKMAFSLFVTFNFLIFTVEVSSASALPLENILVAPAVDSSVPPQPVQPNERDFAWLVVIPIIIAAASLIVAGASLAVNYANRVSPPTPPDQVIARAIAQADNVSNVGQNEVPLPGHTLATATASGNKGSLTVVLADATSQKVDKNINIKLDTRGVGALGLVEGASVSGQAQGLVNGAIVVDRTVVPPQTLAAGVQQQEEALLTVQPAFNISDFRLSRPVKGSLSADIDFELPGTSDSYRWGFTAESGSNGLVITSRRGIFSDGDIVLGNDLDSIASITPPAASFTVPVATDLEFSASTEIAAAETAVPEPSTLLLLGVGLAGLASLRRRKVA